MAGQDVYYVICKMCTKFYSVILVEGSVERCWHRCQCNIKTDLKNVGYEGGNWIKLAQCKVQ